MSEAIQVAVPTVTAAAVALPATAPVVEQPQVAASAVPVVAAVPEVVPTDAAAQAAADATAASLKREATPLEKLAFKIDAKKTQLAKLADEIKKLEQQFEVADKMQGIGQGSVIVARVGRADTAKEVQAVVLGTQNTDAGRRLRITYGEGFDAETAIIQDSQIIGLVQQ